MLKGLANRNHPALGCWLVKTGKVTSGVPERPTRNFRRGVSLKFRRKLSTRLPPELKGGVSTTRCLPHVLLPIQREEQKQAENTRTRKGYLFLLQRATSDLPWQSLGSCLMQRRIMKGPSLTFTEQAERYGFGAERRRKDTWPHLLYVDVSVCERRVAAGVGGRRMFSSFGEERCRLSAFRFYPGVAFCCLAVGTQWEIFNHWLVKVKGLLIRIFKEKSYYIKGLAFPMFADFNSTLSLDPTARFEDVQESKF